MEDEIGVNDLPYEVRTSDELGRYLVATRDLSPGDMVIREMPLIIGPKNMADNGAIMPCLGCYKPVSTDVGERCVKCGWPICSGNCPGLTDPRHHGIECEILSVRPDCVLTDMANYYKHDALLPLRCVLLQNTDPEKWKTLLQMQSHMEYRFSGTVTYDVTEEFIVQYLLKTFINKLDRNVKEKYLPIISSELIHEICGIIDTNSLEIRTREGTEVVALFAKTYMLEHSCVPNTKHNFNLSNKDKSKRYEIKVKIVAPVTKGDHISTMYTHALWGTQARRQHLKENKYFSCKCKRCSDPTEFGTYLSAMKCLGDITQACDGVHLPEDPLDDDTEWACSKCNVKVKNSEICTIMSQMKEEVDIVLNIVKSATLLENVISRLSTFLHPNHYHLYALNHSLVQMYGRQTGYTSLQILDKKINICRNLISITKTLDPCNARVSIYLSVLQNELHLALVMKSQKANSDGTPRSIEDIKPLLVEAKASIEEAAVSLEDDLDEREGEKLSAVIRGNKKKFDRYCKKKNLVL